MLSTMPTMSVGTAVRTVILTYDLLIGNVPNG